MIETMLFYATFAGFLTVVAATVGGGTLSLVVIVHMLIELVNGEV